MKLVYIKRTTRTEKRYSKQMGRLMTDVTYIRKYVLGWPVRTLHKYRETYYGEVKACGDCILSK
jgi:hypothetical protein